MILRGQKAFAKSEAQDAAALSNLVRMSAGSPGLALRLYGLKAPEMQALIASALDGSRSASDVAAELFDLKGKFPGKTPAAQRRTRARIALDVGLELLTDLERALAGVDASDLPHRIVAGPLAESGRLGDRLGRRRIAATWLKAREDLGLNLSPEGLLDRALLSIPRYALRGAAR